MSATPSSGPDAIHEDRRGFRRVFVTLLRAFGSTVALVAIYYLLPLDRTSIGVVIGILAVGLLVLVGLVAFQVRAIMNAAYPVLRAVGALATSVPLFLLLFAGTYFVMGTISADTFSQPMARTDALYFTVTVFSTVGFGDITAVTERGSGAGHRSDDRRHRDRWPRRQDHRRRGQARAAAATDAGRRRSPTQIAFSSRPAPRQHPPRGAQGTNLHLSPTVGEAVRRAPPPRSSMGTAPSLQTAWAVVKPAVMIAWTIMTLSVRELHVHPPRALVGIDDHLYRLVGDPLAVRASPPARLTKGETCDAPACRTGSSPGKNRRKGPPMTDPSRRQRCVSVVCCRPPGDAAGRPSRWRAGQRRLGLDLGKVGLFAANELDPARTVGSGQRKTQPCRSSRL